VGAVVLNTAQTGAVELRMGSDGSLAGPVQQRLKYKRYWHHKINSEE